MRYADLEIELRPAQEQKYLVHYRYRPPDSDAESEPDGGEVTIDPEALTRAAHPMVDAGEYGRELTRQMFADPGVSAGFAEARAAAGDAPLRVRLRLDDAEELNRVRWELLQRPDEEMPLIAYPQLIFSRYVVTADLQAVETRPKNQIRALVVVANPSSLDAEQFAPIDVAEETAVAQESLGPFYSEVLVKPGSEQRATLQNLLDRLKASKFDILYIICHGRIIDGESRLYLEKGDGAVDFVSADKLEVEFIRLREHRPKLVVLASCDSAGDGEGQALLACGPRLAQSGVPAVVAMQDEISMDTNKAFMSAFFSGLHRHGTIDQAFADARWRVHEAPDFWIPVLFMRLRSGRIWTGFSPQATADIWPILTQAIRRKQLVPIVGTGLIEPIIGSLRDISAQWAEEYDYPMFDHERDSIPQIAQFIAVKYGLDFTKATLEEALLKRLKSEHPDAVSDLPPHVSLDETINILAAKRRQRLSQDAYRILARLQLPIYVTANFNRVLESALDEQGKKPHTLISPWNEHVRYCYYGEDPTYPSCQDEMLYDFEFRTINSDNPLVFHPFGRLNDPASVVLTEDEYFEYLTGLQRHENLNILLQMLPRDLFTGTLLFLGFDLVDWEFRVLLQTLFAFESSKLFQGKKHIAVIQLGKTGIKDLEGARDYLQKRLQENWDIHMYVGSAEDFIAELLFFLPAELEGQQR